MKTLYKVLLGVGVVGTVAGGTYAVSKNMLVSSLTTDLKETHKLRGVFFSQVDPGFSQGPYAESNVRKALYSYNAFQLNKLKKYVKNWNQYLQTGDESVLSEKLFEAITPFMERKMGDPASPIGELISGT